jgi:thioredoxin reductase
MLGRCRRRVLVVDDGQPRNASALELHGFLTRDGTPPLELLRLGRDELDRYGVELRHGRVVTARGLKDPISFEITLETGAVFACRRLLLATGVKDEVPEVDGMRRYYGRGVHHCPYCDGWEARDKKLVAFGDPKHSAGLALNLLTWSSDVIVCTNGPGTVPARRAAQLRKKGVEVVKKVVQALVGSDGDDGRLQALVLEDGQRIDADAVFLAVDRHQHSELPFKLGCEIDEKGAVKVKGAQRTRVPGLYLAGDAAADVSFAVVAAAHGAKAAVAIHEDIEKEDLR